MPKYLLSTTSVGAMTDPVGFPNRPQPWTVESAYTATAVSSVADAHQSYPPHAGEGRER